MRVSVSCLASVIGPGATNATVLFLRHVPRLSVPDVTARESRFHPRAPGLGASVTA